MPRNHSQLKTNSNLLRSSLAHASRKQNLTYFQTIKQSALCNERQINNLT